MLHTIKATLSPSGRLEFDGTIKVTRPTSVLVTLLEDPKGEASRVIEDDPLNWELSDEEMAVWDGLPVFQAKHPVRFDSLKDDES